MSALKKAVAAAERLALSEKNMRAKMVAKSIAQDRAKQKSWWARLDLAYRGAGYQRRA